MRNRRREGDVCALRPRIGCEAPEERLVLVNFMSLCPNETITQSPGLSADAMHFSQRPDSRKRRALQPLRAKLWRFSGFFINDFRDCPQPYCGNQFGAYSVMMESPAM